MLFSLLERRLSILQQHLKVILVPGTCLGTGLIRIALTAEAIVPSGAAIAGAVRLAAGLDPDEGVSEVVASGGGRADTETGAVDVAPVAPLLAQTRHAVAARVDDGVVGHAGRLERGPEVVEVQLLVLALVVLGVRGLGELAGGLVPVFWARRVSKYFFFCLLGTEMW